MKKFLKITVAILVILAVCFLAKTYVHAAEAKVKVSKKLYLEMIEKLKKLEKIEKAEPRFEMNGLKVAQDSEGKVYVKDTVEVKLELANMRYFGEAKTNAEVKVFPIKSKEPFISRFGLMFAGQQKEKAKYTELDKAVVFLTYDIYRYAKFAIIAAINKFSYALGIRRSITPNTFIASGVSCDFDKDPLKDRKVFAGIGFRF
jgi:hypothetical protein